ncbi:MAG: ABC transporter permease subunit [Chloroflexota bacterium]
MEGRRALTLVLLGMLAASLLAVPWREGLLHGGGLRAAGDIALAALRPELSWALAGTAVAAAWRTLAYAVAGLSLALALGMPLGIVASGVLAHTRLMRWASIGGARGLLGALRAVHELVWAWLLVAAVGLSPWAGVLALALPYAGILGRVLAELLQDVEAAPLEALRRAGASEAQVLAHGRLPLIVPDAIGYTFYRLECGIRSAAVLSFVGLGGLGFQIQIALADLDFSRAWAFVWVLALLMVLVEMWSRAVRRELAR